jgi:acetyltransferase-like isoleucine patch superfamily enzyme
MNKKPLALIGYRSALDTILEIIEALDIELVGIYDKYFYGNTNETEGIPFIGSEDNISESDKKNLNFFLSSGWAGHVNNENLEHHGDNLRQTRIKLIREQGLNTINLINPTAWVHKTSLEIMGTGVAIGRHCQVRARTRIGDFSYIDNLSSLGHDINVGENLVMPPYSFIAGNIDIGNNVMIGAGSTIVSRYRDRKLNIGNNVKIIAGSTVFKDVPEGKVFASFGKTKLLDRIDI